MRRLRLLVPIMFIIGCEHETSDTDAVKAACQATHARLEALGCEENMKSLLSRGCFETDLAPDDCDMAMLDPCTEEIRKFAEEPGGWRAPLDTFLDRKCGPEGTKTIEWPEPDLAGQVAINLVVKSNGEVGSSVVQDSKLDNSTVSNCMARTIKKWTFPAPRGGGNAIVTISFSLSGK